MESWVANKSSIKFRVVNNLCVSSSWIWTDGWMPISMTGTPKKRWLVSFLMDFTDGISGRSWKKKETYFEALPSVASYGRLPNIPQILGGFVASSWSWHKHLAGDDLCSTMASADSQLLFDHCWHPPENDPGHSYQTDLVSTYYPLLFQTQKGW